ncbi:hypothetical protein ENU1_091720 [Entamoeba nuttalli P19]|uniref:TLDc domain-containing protein n=1 Tax=Entamoeba nuttalli (strain P19) TaxID=1076696 RepID=K2GCW4_ENTNP|nr:hypothetical protein ENU1_091720 [Entamoeba nuttalli P19]EKE40396.1 hypothetical protein ENU1_091720 [Entamoeba nuttalli P19]|eukprot:XP_008857273.1 hypothetical protein ENU1_091720 [Entamoeba nuttalli P19]
MGTTTSAPQEFPDKRKTIKMIKQLEEWTEKRVGNILFDSNVHNWNRFTSVFDLKLLYKKHIIIIVEDTQGNIFGEYVNSKIDKVDAWINDPHAFVFSLESKGRLKKMMKFDIKEPKYGFFMESSSYGPLFDIGFGRDIGVYKQNYSTKSFCLQFSFEYDGISNALCGKRIFKTKQVIVIEMK